MNRDVEGMGQAMQAPEAEDSNSEIKSLTGNLTSALLIMHLMGTQVVTTSAAIKMIPFGLVKVRSRRAKRRPDPGGKHLGHYGTNSSHTEQQSYFIIHCPDSHSESHPAQCTNPRGQIQLR